MEDIRIYDFDFNLVAIIPDIASAVWSFRYNGVASTEVHIPANSEVVPKIMEKRYLVMVQGSKQAVITGKPIKDNELVLYGRSMNWLLTKRVLEPFKTRELFENGEILGLDSINVIRWCFNKCYKTEGTAYISNMVIGTELDSYTFSQYFWRNVANTLEDVLAALLDKEDAGHELVFDIENKRFVLNFFKGGTLDTLISQSNKTAYNAELDDDFQSYASVGWYPKSESEENTEWCSIVKNSTDMGIYRYDTVLSSTSESEATDEMNKKNLKRLMSAKIRGLEWGKDYCLGDTVRVQFSKGSFSSAQVQKITDITVAYDADGVTVTPIFKEA